MSNAPTRAHSKHESKAKCPIRISLGSSGSLRFRNLRKTIMITKSAGLMSRALLVAAALSAALPFVSAQTTNWIAYNDHRPSAAPVASGWAKTGTNVSGYDMGAPADLAPSTLTNRLNGAPLTATVSFTRTGSPDDFGAVGRPILTNTPMARIFYGICDLSNDGLVGVHAVPPNADRKSTRLNSSHRT